MDGLSGKTALVTGGGKGIGAGIARRLAAEGVSVAITYSASGGKARDLVSEIQANGGAAMAIQADAADADAVIAAIAQTIVAFGKLDILVNNAGMGVSALIDEMPLEDYDRCFAVNVRAMFVAIKEAARHMGQGGRIINIGSVNGDRIPFQYGAIYAATKAAVGGLTRGAARDLGNRGITVNVVQPGPIDTDMNPADGPYAASGLVASAVGHYGQPQDIAAMVAFLASSEAGYITGASFNVDGGYNA
ncbi:MAG TPA: SDR family oxidoreductase [Alphaproteobacteria bacterium]|nr:SDR family oxidoreductase [Alphaproteobacteria bacterium]